MSRESELRKSVILSDHWADAPKEDRERVLENMRSVFVALANWNVEKNECKEQLRSILTHEKDWLDPQATACMLRTGKRLFHASSVFHFVERTRAYEWVGPLVEAGFDISLKDTSARAHHTALERAIMNDDAEGVKVLALHGADIEKTLIKEEDEEVCLLQYALDSEHYNAASALIEAGADINRPYMFNSLGPGRYSIAQYSLFPDRCRPEILKNIVRAGHDPLAIVDSNDPISHVEHIIEVRHRISEHYRDAVLEALCDVGVPLQKIHESCSSLSDLNDIADMLIKVHEEGDAVWRKFSEDRAYVTLDKHALCRLSNIGKLDDVFKQPVHWRTPQNASFALDMLDMLPPYLQENYTHERSLMEETVQAKETGWSR